MWRKTFPPVALIFLLSSCLPQHLYQTSAPPVEKVVTLVESHPKVKEALGEPVSVSLAVSRRFSRDFLKKKTSGIDRVDLLTSVKGSTAEAELDLDATNVNEQGWAGRFELRTLGTLKLENGSYVSSGAREILHGTFAPDGTPLVAE